VQRRTAHMGGAASAGLDRCRRGEPPSRRGWRGGTGMRVVAASAEASALGCRRVRRAEARRRGQRTRGQNGRGRAGCSTGTATSSRLRRRAAGRLTARTLACWGAARVEEDGMRGRRSGCRLKPAQARGAAGPERAARRRKRQGRSCERRRSACFGLPAGAARGGTMARQEDSGAERLLGA